jgi:hypothetical protein
MACACTMLHMEVNGRATTSLGTDEQRCARGASTHIITGQGKACLAWEVVMTEISREKGTDDDPRYSC